MNLFILPRSQRNLFLVDAKTEYSVTQNFEYRPDLFVQDVLTNSDFVKDSMICNLNNLSALTFKTNSNIEYPNRHFLDEFFGG